MPTAKLTRSAPYFPVADVARSAAHYQRVFGFQTEYSAGSPAEFAIVTRDSFSIMLRRVADAGPISPNERQGGTWAPDNADVALPQRAARHLRKHFSLATIRAIP